MNRRQRKLEQKRKKRKEAKKKARALAARKPPALVLVAGAAARSPFDTCYISAGWDDEEEAQLVTVIVTHRLPDGQLVAASALVDRTCLGIKDGNVDGPMDEDEVEELVDFMAQAHGGMEECDLLLAQSVVFHGIDYAHRLGFSPHRDFDERLFGPRPAELLDTPWRNEERPLYVTGPRDNVDRILERLEAAVGAGNFDVAEASLDEWEVDEEELDEPGVLEGVVVEKPADR